MLAPGAERIIGNDRSLEVIADNVIFGEGPVWDRASKQFFFSDIIGFLIRFVISEKIAKWIAEQGGWVSLSFSF